MSQAIKGPSFSHSVPEVSLNVMSKHFTRCNFQLCYFPPSDFVDDIAWQVTENHFPY